MLTPQEAERFRSKYTEQPSGCWTWNGPLDKDGYGTFFLRRRSRKAHRVGWFSTRGEIPKGLVIDHLCGIRCCVNPSHLRLQTPRQNSLENSRSPAAVNAQKTHCKRGHAFDRFYSGQRCCSQCEAAKARRLNAKWRAEDTLNV